MKKILVVLLAVLVMLPLTACAKMQAKIADEVENLGGVEGKTLEEHEKYYQEEWDALSDGLLGLFKIASEEGKKQLEQNELTDEAEEVVEVVEEVVEVAEDIYQQIMVEKRITELASSYGNRYDGSDQCKGFARMVMRDLFGSDATVPSTAEHPYNYTLKDTSGYGVELVGSLTDVPSRTNEEIAAFFAQARPGDLIQMRRNRASGTSHSAIVVSVSETGMVWLEANLDDNNGISKNTYTWADFNKNQAMSIYTAKDYQLAK